MTFHFFMHDILINSGLTTGGMQLKLICQVHCLCSKHNQKQTTIIMCIPQVLRAGCSPFNHLDLSNCNKEKHSP